MLYCLDGGEIKNLVTKTCGDRNGASNWELLYEDSEEAVVEYHNG